ncbi:MAG TPA: protein kinase [Pseudomonadota bacterium]|nr:protein kinase [Pseudomonadota bacterium]
MSVPSTSIPGYELIRELGIGGMATVYLAIQRSLDRKVAIKVMKRNIDDLEKFERRFLMEGRTMAKLPHRNIVAVYDIVKNEDVTYIAMELLDGGTLSDRMKAGLSLGDAISIVVQVAQALQFAHEHGIVHRDLKPANIMFRDAHTPVLTDFGIAKQQDATATRLTQTGMLVGTPTYMSPEQINALEVDGRSDLYSLGVLFYELLTGAPPFVADTPIAVLRAHLTTPAPPLPPQFADFQPVVDAMLAKNRDERFASLKEFTRALKGAVVNNENLWAKLQADPNQSSSEQLRALGFSISGSNTAEGMQSPVSGQVRLPPSGRGTARTPTPRPAPGAGRVPTGEMQAPAPGPRWGLIGAAAAVVIGLAVAGVMLWPKPDVDPVVKRLVDFALVEVDRAIEAKDLAKAAEMLQASLAQAPKYQAVQDRLDNLVAALKAEADAAIGRKDLDTALARLEQARLLNENDPGLKALSDRIAGERAAAEQAVALAELLRKADAATRAGRDLTPGGAYQLLSEARAKAPNDPQVKQRLDALVARALKPAQDALRRNDAAAAQASIAQLAGVLANEPAWQQLNTQVRGAAEAQAAKARLAGILASLDAQIAAGRLIDPPNDNAQQTLGQAMALAATDPQVLARQEKLAAALATQGRAALDAGQVEQALQRASLALNVKPDHAPALALKKTVEGRLDAKQAKLIEILGRAQQALAEERFLSPSGTNAKALLTEALALDPRNVEALSLVQQLPARLLGAARARADRGDLEGAGRLVDEGRKAFPGDAGLAQLGNSLAQQQATAQAKLKRDQQFERIAQLLATRPLKPDNIATAGREIAALIAANPRDMDAATQKARLFESLDESLAAAERNEEIEAIANATQQLRQAFGTDPAYARVSTNLEAARTRVATAERERLATISGELVLNAYPWARVESVVDANRKPVALPQDAVTPLRLSLPAGVYTVTYRHPQAQRPATQVAQVQAKQSVTAAASFSAAVSSKDYLKRAGW